MIRATGKRASLFISLALLFLAASAPVISPETESSAPKSTADKSQMKPDLLVGTWVGGGCIYTINYEGMLMIQRIGAPADSIRGRYSWFRMGEHDCISIQMLNGDTLSRTLLIGAVTDSLAVIALGSPFIRVDGGKGIPGTWKHLDRYSRMEWKLGPDTAEYRRTLFNPKTGEVRGTESRIGSYHAASNKYEDGSFQLSFQDGSRAVVLPIVYRDLMYLFDLSPAKSLFSRIREPVAEAGISAELPPEKVPEKN